MGLNQSVIAPIVLVPKGGMKHENSPRFVRCIAHRRLRFGPGGTEGREQHGLRLCSDAADRELVAADSDQSVLGELPAGQPGKHQVLIVTPRGVGSQRGTT